MFRRLRSTFFERTSATDARQRPDGVRAGRAYRRGAPTGPAPSLDPAVVPRYFGPVPNFAHSPAADARPRRAGGGRDRDAQVRRPAAHPAASRAATTSAATCRWPRRTRSAIRAATTTRSACRSTRSGCTGTCQPTRLRGYRQLNCGTDPAGHNTVAPPERPWHLGPMILARRGRPVRVKFINQLPTGRAGELFLPVDDTIEGAGLGPLDGPAPYPQNRAVLHLAGAQTGWTSAGNPGQWITPAGETTPYPTGVGPDPRAGHAATRGRGRPRSTTRTSRAAGCCGSTTTPSASPGSPSTAGSSALYLLTDPAEDQLVADAVLPADQLPLVIEDKTFVPDDAQLAAEDPTWDRDRWGARGSLWHPHVYQPRQNPYRSGGRNPTGRWDYGPWFCAAATGRRPCRRPGAEPVPRPGRRAGRAAVEPGVPHPSAVPEAYGDTPLVNGAAYPYLEVRPRAYRFRILNACLDRSLNLQLYRACSDAPMWTADGALADADAGEVPMVPAVRAADRPDGVADRRARRRGAGPGAPPGRSSSRSATRPGCCPRRWCCRTGRSATATTGWTRPC